jgi:hypothetical protein
MAAMMEKIRPFLIDDYHNLMKFWSMRWIILTTFFGSVIAAYNTLPGDWLPIIPHWFKLICSYGVIFSGSMAGVARVINQSAIAERRNGNTNGDR